MEAIQWLLDKRWVLRWRCQVDGTDLAQVGSHCVCWLRPSRNDSKSFCWALLVQKLPSIINESSLFPSFVHYFSLSRRRHHCHVPTDTKQLNSADDDNIILAQQMATNRADKEFVFQNLENGISLFNAETLETKLLMDNSSFVSLNHFNVLLRVTNFLSRHLLCAVLLGGSAISARFCPVCSRQWAN